MNQVISKQQKRKGPGRPPLHGLIGLIRHGRIPEGSEQLAAEIDASVARAIDELGRELTENDTALFAQYRLALLVVALANEYLAANGILKSARVLPLALSYGNQARRIAAALGLTKTEPAKPTDSLESITLAIAAEREREAELAAEQDESDGDDTR